MRFAYRLLLLDYRIKSESCSQDVYEHLVKHGETIPHGFTGIPVEEDNRSIGVVEIRQRLSTQIAQHRW